MTKKVPYRTILLILFSFIFTSIYAQKNSSRSWNDTNEYAMSHVEVEAGGITGLVLPNRIATINKKSCK